MDEGRVCGWCLTEIPSGGLVYRVRLAVTADFDGFIDADAPENQPAGLQQVLSEIAGRSADELADEVHRERELLLCRRCADKAWAAVPPETAPQS